MDDEIDSSLIATCFTQTCRGADSRLVGLAVAAADHHIYRQFEWSADRSKSQWCSWKPAGSSFSFNTLLLLPDMSYYTPSLADPIAAPGSVVSQPASQALVLANQRYILIFWMLATER